MAGPSSVPKSIRSAKIAEIGAGIPSKTNTIKAEISGVEWVKVYRMLFFKFANIKRPSAIPVTIDAKLSSKRIIEADSFETSDAVLFMEIPKSAFFKAGLSFTPSPLTPTMCPLDWNLVTISNVCLGDVLHRLIINDYINENRKTTYSPCKNNLSLA